MRKKQQQHPKRAIQVRVEPALSDEVEDWRRAQPKIPPRSDAMRQLLRKGIAAYRAERLVKQSA